MSPSPSILAIGIVGGVLCMTHRELRGLGAIVSVISTIAMVVLY